MKLFFIAGVRDYEKLSCHVNDILDFLEDEYNRHDVELLFPYSFLYRDTIVQEADKISTRNITGRDNSIVSYNDGERIRDYMIDNSLNSIEKVYSQLGSDYYKQLEDKLASDLETMSWCDGVCAFNRNNVDDLEKVFLSQEYAKSKELGLTTFLIPNSVLIQKQKTL